MTKESASIVDPWLNGDPCEDCKDCEKVCRKLQERIDVVIQNLMTQLEFKDLQIKTLMKYNEANNDWGMTLFQALENLYNDYAAYYPSAVDNSPAMKAAYELIHEEDEEQ